MWFFSDWSTMCLFCISGTYIQFKFFGKWNIHSGVGLRQTLVLFYRKISLFRRKSHFSFFWLAALFSGTCQCPILILWSDSCDGMLRLTVCANTVLLTVLIFFNDIVFSPTFLLKHFVLRLWKIIFLLFRWLKLNECIFKKFFLVLVWTCLLWNNKLKWISKISPTNVAMLMDLLVMKTSWSQHGLLSLIINRKFFHFYQPLYKMGEMNNFTTISNFQNIVIGSSHFYRKTN